MPDFLKLGLVGILAYLAYQLFFSNKSSGFYPPADETGFLPPQTETTVVNGHQITTQPVFHAVDDAFSSLFL